jgi:hypothetical protein
MNASNLIKIQRKGLEILQAISTYESLLKMNISFIDLNEKNGFSTDRITHRSEIYIMVIKRLFERYEKNQQSIKKL